MVAVSAWDTYSKNLMKDLRAAALPDRVAFVSVLVEGETAEWGATLLDLDRWRSQLPGSIHVIDPRFAQLKPLSNLASTSLGLAIIDARSMEIVSVDIGIQFNPKTKIEAARDTIKARPPAY